VRWGIILRVCECNSGRLVLGEAAEEAGGVPVGALGTIGDFFCQGAEEVVEAGGAFEIDGLLEVVRRGVVALLQPGLGDLFLGRSFRLIAAVTECHRGRSVVRNPAGRPAGRQIGEAPESARANIQRAGRAAGDLHLYIVYTAGHPWFTVHY